MECDSLSMIKRVIWSVFVYVCNGHKVCVIPQNLGDLYKIVVMVYSVSSDYICTACKSLNVCTHKLEIC